MDSSLRGITINAANSREIGIIFARSSEICILVAAEFVSDFISDMTHSLIYPGILYTHLHRTQRQKELMHDSVQLELIKIQEFRRTSKFQSTNPTVHLLACVPISSSYSASE